MFLTPRLSLSRGAGRGVGPEKLFPKPSSRKHSDPVETSALQSLACLCLYTARPWKHTWHFTTSRGRPFLPSLTILWTRWLRSTRNSTPTQESDTCVDLSLERGYKSSVTG